MPLRIESHGLQVYACGPWCQGPALLQLLRLLEGRDLRALIHPDSFEPHAYFPGRVNLEARIPRPTGDGLCSADTGWSGTGISVHRCGADPRRAAYAVGW